ICTYTHLNSRLSLHPHHIPTRDPPYPPRQTGDKPCVHEMPPYRSPPHVEGIRGVPLIISNPNPNGYINPVMEWDTNNPMDGIAWSSAAFGTSKETLFAAVYGVIDNGPDSLVPTWPVVIQIDFLNPTAVRCDVIAQKVDRG